MRLAIISDTHFGDPMCALMDKSKKGVDIINDEMYRKLREAVGEDINYLILLGDILDDSIVNYCEAYKIAKIFFKRIKTDGIAREIIYIPGNHDFDVWHTVEYQVNVINRINKGLPVRLFKQSLPAVMDLREKSTNKDLVLPGVEEKKGTIKYSGLFLDNITGIGSPTHFNFAYPNMYIITDDRTILLTHGQYFQQYWSIAGEVITKIAKKDLQIDYPISIKELVGLNFPTNQLASSGVGQAYPLTPLIRKIQRDVKDGDFKDLKKYIERLKKYTDENMEFPILQSYKELFSDFVLNQIKKVIFNYIEEIESPRFDSGFIFSEDFENRFTAYYKSCLEEIEELKDENINVPDPDFMIFGHTHAPIPWNSGKVKKITINNQTRKITLYNTGGWLYRHDRYSGKEFCGAEIFIYDDINDFSSIQIQ